MKKYELALAPNYVPHWKLEDAVRELFQNAIDQRVTNRENEMFFDYDENQEVLRIGNKLSVLDIQSLLLGNTEKAEDSNTIGQFGEGYKIATLVLLRLGKRITFYNYGKKEVWRPRFVNSRRYGTQILTFFVEKHTWTSVPDKNLTIEIEGISEQEYTEIAYTNLHILKPIETIDVVSGRILLDKVFRGKVFVGGLKVCEFPSYCRGYDFNPGLLKLDRDRKLASDFDLKWAASTLWGETESNNDVLVALISAGTADVAFLKTHIGRSRETEIADLVFEKFRSTYGLNAIPSYYSSDTANLAKKYRPVTVSEVTYSMIKASSFWKEPERIPVVNLSNDLEKWYFELIENYEIDDETQDNFRTILTKLQIHFNELED
jgi:hypothetical protein